MAEAKLKIAVFIDFDNIEIGVKTTLGTHFDAGAVLEAIKERGDVVTKIAYGDWTRAGDYSRSLTQHAIHMVQRNLTPGGDKNGADINLALDALEMAFTHSHINTFVIVGGDSDFMALVEKLKQYDRKVLVVGGRAFTSQILQKNCHEFIAYENLIGRRPGARGRAPQEAPLAGAVTLVRRALKVLADREVSPQLGVLKSTLLQLDPTFSEREYGVGTFRDLVQRLARAGYVVLKGTDRNIYVELKEGTDGAPLSATPQSRDNEPLTIDGQDAPADAEPIAVVAPMPAPAPVQVTGPVQDAAPVVAADAQDTTAAAHLAGRQQEGYRLIDDVFQRSGVVSRWPLYLRQVKQILRTADESFDERKYGFSGLVEALRFCQREGLFRLDRDRQGVLRVYPGVKLQRTASLPAAGGRDEGERDPVAAEPLAEPQAGELFAADAPARAEDGQADAATETSADVDGNVWVAPAEPEVEVARPPRRRSTTKKASAPPAAPRKSAPSAPRGRSKPAAAPRRSRKPESSAD